MLAADPSDVVYRGRFHNQYTSFGRTGNHPSWKRGFKEFGIYACPMQLQVGFAPLPVGSYGDKGIPAWVRHVASAVEWVTSAGSKVRLIAVDREFYSATSFAAAGAGLLAPTLAATDQPRLLCPTRFWHSKKDPTWEFLTATDSADVTETTVELSKKEAKRIGPAAAVFLSNSGKYLVPVAIVAGFDTYPAKHAPSPLSGPGVKRSALTSRCGCASRTRAGETRVRILHGESGRRHSADASQKGAEEAILH